MAIRDLNRWHWAAIGLALGLAFGASRVIWPIDFAQGIGPVLSQREFERELLASTEDGTPRLTQMVIHPPDADGRSWVVGRRMVASSHGERAELFRFAAAQVYRPLGQPGDSPPLNIEGYLRQMKALHPESRFSYQLAWWERTWCVLSVGAGVGLLAIGLIWPPLLQMMLGAGLAGPREEPAYDLDHFGRSPTDSKLADAMERVQQNDQLNDYVEAMLDSQTHGPTPAPAQELAKQAHDTRVTPVLDGGSLDALQLTPESPKDYQGEYYPVARPAATNSHQESDEISGTGSSQMGER